jgi:hypothetical protein
MPRHEMWPKNHYSKTTCGFLEPVQQIDIKPLKPHQDLKKIDIELPDKKRKGYE